MLGETTYIRKFTPEQRQQMEAVAMAFNLKTAPQVLFFTLGKYMEQQQDIARLKRLMALKQTKYEALQTQLKEQQNTIETLKQQLDAYTTPNL